MEGYKENNALNNYLINGTLDFHGVTKKIQNINVQIKKLDSKLSFKGKFELNPKEFDVEIPKIVSSKIADKVIVVFEFSMMKK
jgi:polyisoprenoid-binding protein YceI